MPLIKTRSMRDAFSEAIYELGRAAPRVIVLCADQDRTFQLFKQKIRERYIEVGIAEANMVGIAAGVAHCGMIPYVTSIAGILTMRACEQIRDDVCYNRLPVRIVGHGAGISYGSLGTTHHAIEDLAMMRAIPNMTVVVPADAIEVKKVVEASLNYPDPMYIRIGTGDDPVVYDQSDDAPFEIGKAIVLKGGNDAKIFGAGSCLAHALSAAHELEQDGIAAGVVNVHTIKPLDRKVLLEEAGKAKVLVFVEEHNRLGGLGSALAELFLGKISRPVEILGIPDTFSSVANREDLYARYGLDSKGIANTIKRLLA